MRIKDPDKRKHEILALKSKVREAIDLGQEIIFTDEAMFTTATLPDRGYAQMGDNVSIEEKLVSTPAVAVVAGISSKNGLVAFNC